MNILDSNEISKTPYTRLIVSKKNTLHCHTFFEFSICISGSLTNHINGEDYAITSGTVVLLRPQDKHYIVSKDGHISRDIYIQSELLKSLCDCIDSTLYERILTQPLTVFFKISDYELQRLESKLSLFNNANDFSELQLHSAHINTVTELFYLWQQSLLPKKNLPDWLTTLLQQISNTSFIGKNIDEVIQSTHYSHGYVCREFKKYMGTTLQEYLSSVKFSYAIALLEVRENTVEQIAFKLNYSSASIFIAAFKRKFGISPAQWRKEQKSAISNKIVIE